MIDFVPRSGRGGRRPLRGGRGRHRAERGAAATAGSEAEEPLVASPRRRTPMSATPAGRIAYPAGRPAVTAVGRAGSGVAGSRGRRLRERLAAARRSCVAAVGRDAARSRCCVAPSWRFVSLRALALRGAPRGERCPGPTRAATLRPRRRRSPTRARQRSTRTPTSTERPRRSPPAYRCSPGSCCGVAALQAPRAGGSFRICSGRRALVRRRGGARRPARGRRAPGGGAARGRRPGARRLPESISPGRPARDLPRRRAGSDSRGLTTALSRASS